MGGSLLIRNNSYIPFKEDKMPPTLLSRKINPFLALEHPLEHGMIY